jgi:cytochrome P450
VFDAKIIAAVLKSAEFVAADFAEIHRTLEQKVGIDCSALIRIFEHSANANEGDRHAAIRKDLARALTTDLVSTKRRTAGVLHELVPQVCRAGTRIDLVGDIIEPVCDALFESILGVERTANSKSDVSPSQIFDLYLGLNRRRQINAKARAMLEAFSAAKENIKTSPDYAAALSMVGYDSIVGSLACSLLHVLRQSEGERLCDFTFPRLLPATGVPYIERFATKECALAGANIREGERVRLYLEAGCPGKRGAEDRPFFGKGRHSCIGEELSTWLWQTLTGELARLPLVCTIERATRRKPDWVFTYYSSIVACLHA